MNNPSVTVLLPVYNAAPYLSEAISSILQQTFRNFEFLIINDGSIDDSEEIILSFSDSRIRYYKNSFNIGLIDTLNKGIDLSNGTFIARMDADDISLPQRLEKQINFMERNPTVDICGSSIKMIGQKQQVIRPYSKDKEIKTKLLFSNALYHPTLMIRKKVFDRKKYNNDYQMVEDYKLWVELSPFVQYFNLPDVLLHYRTHNHNVSKNPLQKERAKKVKFEAIAFLLGIQDISEDQKKLHFMLLYPWEIFNHFCLDEILEWIYFLRDAIKRNNLNLGVFDKEVSNRLYSLINFHSQKAKDYFKYFCIPRFLRKIPLLKKFKMLIKGSRKLIYLSKLN